MFMFMRNFAANSGLRMYLARLLVVDVHSLRKPSCAQLLLWKKRPVNT